MSLQEIALPPSVCLAMLQSLMVSWFPSAKPGRNVVQSLCSVFGVGMSLLCPRLWADLCGHAGPACPLWALWLWPFWGTQGEELVLTPPSHSACLCLPQEMCNDVASELAASGDLPKTSVCPRVLPQLGAVPVVWHKFLLTWMHKKQILFTPELMPGRHPPGEFYPCLWWEKNDKVNKMKNIFIPFKLWDN